MFGRLTSAKVNLPVKLTCVGLVGSSVVDECASEQNLTGEVWSVSAGNDRLIFKQQFPPRWILSPTVGNTQLRHRHDLAFDIFRQILNDSRQFYSYYHILSLCNIVVV